MMTCLLATLFNYFSSGRCVTELYKYDIACYLLLYRPVAFDRTRAESVIWESHEGTALAQ